MATHGRKAELLIGAAGATPPTSWDEIELIREGTFNRQKAEIDVTTRDSGMDDEFIPGGRNATYDATGIFDEEKDGIQAVLDNYEADDVVVWFCDRPKGTGAGLPENVFQGFVTTATVAMPFRDAETIQITVRVSGPVITRSQTA